MSPSNGKSMTEKSHPWFRPATSPGCQRLLQGHARLGVRSRGAPVLRGLSSGPQIEPGQRKTRSRPRELSGSRERRGCDGSGGSQLSRGLGDTLRDLGELQAGALHHAGLTATLVGTDHVTVAFTVQLVILRACSERPAARA